MDEPNHKSSLWNVATTVTTDLASAILPASVWLFRILWDSNDVWQWWTDDDTFLNANKVRDVEHLLTNVVALHDLDPNDLNHSPPKLWCSIGDFFSITNELQSFLTTSTMASLRESSCAGRPFTFVLFHWGESGDCWPPNPHQVSRLAALVAKLSYLPTWTLNSATERWENRRWLSLTALYCLIIGVFQKTKLVQLFIAMSQELGVNIYK